MTLDTRFFARFGALLLIVASVLGGNFATAQAPNAAYRVRPGDKLFISVWKEEGLEQTVIVRPDGGITFPLAGEISAGGKTIGAITEEIRTRLVRFIPEALVTVDVAE